MLPLGLPAIASLAIFQFLWTWNDLIVSLTFGVTPITVWIFGQLREFGTSIDVIAPASFISLSSRWPCSSRSSATSCRACWRAR